jgi:hypothetical protein
MYCLRDVTQVAEAHASPLADMEPLVAYRAYRAYRVVLSLIVRHQKVHNYLGRAFLVNNNSSSLLPHLNLIFGPPCCYQRRNALPCDWLRHFRR